MRAFLLLVVITTTACGTDHVAEVDRAAPNTEPNAVPNTVPNAVEATPAVASGSALPAPNLQAAHAEAPEPAVEFDPLAPPLRLAASDAEVREARALCGRGWRAFQQGDLALARTQMDAAIAVLAFGTSEDARQGHGACLYNRGRWAEQSGRMNEARALYAHSLFARPDDTVRARLASLPAAPITEVAAPAEIAPDEDDEEVEAGMTRPLDADAALLFDHRDSPCRDDVHCAFAIAPMSAHASGLRASVVEVWQHDSEDGADFPNWRGGLAAALTLRLAIQRPREPLRWGPVVARYDADMAESIAFAARLEFVTIEGSSTPLVLVHTELSVSEMCCGGRSTTDTSEDVFCALHAADEPSACAHALVEHTFEGSAEDPSDDSYGGGSSRYRATARVRGHQLIVTATLGEAPSHVATPVNDRFAAQRTATGIFDLSTL